MIHRAKATDVRTVMVGGRVLLKDRKFVDYDVDSLFREVRAIVAKGVPEAARAQREPVGRLLPHYQRWHNAMLKHLDVTEPFYMLNGRR